MTVVHEREPVTGVLRAMAADTDVCEELVRAARGRSPELARLGEAETLSHVNALIGAAEAWLTTLGRVEEHDFAAALLLGADRAAQGIPMTAVLRGVQAALTRVVEITVERSRSAGVSDAALLTVVLRLKEYGDALERHVVNGYRAAESGTPRGAGEARARLLRRLLAEGDDTPVPSRAELAREGVRADGRYHCVVADPGDPAHARALTAPGSPRCPGSSASSTTARWACVRGCRGTTSRRGRAGTAWRSSSRHRPPRRSCSGRCTGCAYGGWRSGAGEGCAGCVN